MCELCLKQCLPGVSDYPRHTACWNVYTIFSMKHSMHGSVVAQKHSLSFSLRVYLKGLGCIWAIEHLHGMRRVLGSNPSTIVEI